MSDKDLKETNPKNLNRIIACEDWQVRYWRTVIGCSTSELKAAIKSVGNSVDAVKNYFSTNNQVRASL